MTIGQRASFNKQPVVLSLPEFSLFSDDAPLLSVFSLKRVPVRLQVPWLSQLRHLGLASQVAVSELLERLKEMPLIETFDLDLTTPPFQVPITIDLPNIILPRRRHIRVAVVFDMCTPLLEHINPSPGCALSLDCQYPPMGPNNITTAAEVDYGPLRRVLSRYSQSYLDHHIVTAVLLAFLDILY
ncbi:hypothetical protein BDZ97DRAFT_1919590 [Flammula alnicola]|nr:hypothetical protein BDZ97DRAFT_1919590 [Flammula alnicola]